MDSQAGGAAVLGVAFMRVHQPRIAYNMAGYGTVGGNRGGHFPDTTSQTNPNMMQMGQSGGNGNTPTNVPSSTQNTPLTPNTPGQLGTAQPGTTLTQPVTNPTQPPHNPLNQANPNSPTNTPGSTQNTTLQNNTRTVYSANNPPPVTDNISVPRRPVPNYTPEELERFRNYTADWHKRDDWPVEIMDVVGGHGAERHVYYSWKETADRIINPQPGARIPTASSRTLTIEDADRLAKETLKSNGNIIDNWLANSEGKYHLILTYKPSEPQLTGFGIRRGDTEFLPTTRMTVVIVRTPNGYIVDKYYPSFE